MLATLRLWLGLVPVRRHLIAIDLLFRARAERDELGKTCVALRAENRKLRQQVEGGVAHAAKLRDVLRRWLREGVRP